ncbi:MAG: hypothetical protein AABX83_03010 [Nanoarchaeota archaeon]
MEKRSFALIFIICVFFANGIYAQSVLQNATNKNDFESDADKILNATRKLQGLNEQSKWEYLGQQWKAVILKNKIIAFWDGFFRKINFIFFFVFGQNYDLSLTLLFAILLWVFFFGVFGKIFTSFSTFSQGVSYLVGFIFATILGHIKFYNFLSTFIFKVIFFKEGIWRWIFLLIYFMLYFVILVFFEQVIWKIGRHFKKTQEEKDKWDEKFKRQVFEKKLEGIEKGLGGIGKALEYGENRKASDKMIDGMSKFGRKAMEDK